MIPSAAVRAATQVDSHTQHGRGAQAVVLVAASLLMLASAGFGCHFAHTQGAHHGPALAAFAVAMALGLELAKPFAVEAAFACFRGWAIGRGVALLLLGLVAIAYSLTAELSLMATTRADVVAERQKQNADGATALGTLQRAKDELATLDKARPKEAEHELKASKAKAEATLAKVGWTSSKCAEIATWQSNWGEKAACSRLVTVAPSLEYYAHRKKAQDKLEAAEGKAGTTGPQIAADPGAAALATYLATFGLAIPASLLSEWLVLVGVLALEIGSALSVLLVRAMGSSDGARRGVGQDVDTAAWRSVAAPARPPEATPEAAPRTVQGQSRSNRGQRLGAGAGVSKKAAAGRIVDALVGAGGRLEGGTVRRLAALIGGRKSTVHSALAALVATGVVARIGSKLVLTT